MAADTKEFFHMHLFLARAMWCTVTGVASWFIICVKNGVRIWQGGVLLLRRSGVVGAPYAPHGVGFGCSGMMRRFSVVLDEPVVSGIARCRVIRAE